MMMDSATMLVAKCVHLLTFSLYPLLVYFDSGENRHGFYIFTIPSVV